MRDDFGKIVQIRERKRERSGSGGGNQKADEEVKCCGVPGSARTSEGLKTLDHPKCGNGSDCPSFLSSIGGRLHCYC